MVESRDGRLSHYIVSRTMKMQDRKMQDLTMNDQMPGV